MAKLDLRSLDAGRLRHPLYGNRRHWYTQRVRAGFWTKTMRKEAKTVRKAMLAVADEVARELKSRS